VVTIHTGGQVALPVRPGDAISALLCLNTDPAGHRSLLLGQLPNGELRDRYRIPAGPIHQRGHQPRCTLSQSGWLDSAWYFDEIVAFTTEGTRLLTDGGATTMVDSQGSTLATPVRLYENAFKIV
jgi:hypothetical protein